MQGKKKYNKQLSVFVNIEDLIPDNHYLRKIDRIFDAIKRRKKVRIYGGIVSTDSFINKKELPQMADRKKSPV